MGDRSGIEWTEATWNPTTGCDRISPGCDNCYALKLAKRLKAMGNPKYQNDGDERTSGPGFGLTLHEDALTQPLRWRSPRVIFVNSMSDLFHESVPDGFIRRVFEVMAQTPRHTYQVLTKRSHRLRALAPSLDWPPNVWMGTSVESDRYTFRIDHLRDVPAAVRFLSLEPLLGPVPSLDLDGIQWVIIGGESGFKARPMEVEWVRSIMTDAANAKTAVFVKQMGSVGYTRKGGDMSEWPVDLRVRDLPSAPSLLPLGR
jgi:protein gp37